MATYSDIGIHLKSKALTGIPEEYQEWISMYSSDEFKELAGWITDLINVIGSFLV